MNEYFDNVTLDDKLWSVGYGWGKVWACEVNPARFVVIFGDTLVRYSYDGHESGSVCAINQTLFWDEIKITPPPKPKKEVVHDVVRWVNIYPDSNHDAVHRSKQDADEAANLNERIACVKLTGAYITWED